MTWDRARRLGLRVALYLVEIRPALVKFEQASNGPKCTCTVVAVYPVTSAYHARDSTCHAHSLAFVKFEVPFLPIDPGNRHGCV